MTIGTLLRATTGAVAGLAIAAMAVAEAKTLKLNAGDSPGTLVETAMKRFKELVEQKTNKEFEIRVFMGAQLGGPQESLENLKTGTLELYGGDLSYYATLMPDELGIITLMYFFQDNQHLRRYLESDYFKKAADEKLVGKNGTRLINEKWLGFRGPYRVFVSAKPIMKVEDLQGIKMRLWPNDIVIRQWRHLGAVPTVMSWNEVYLAIRQGTIQAVTGPIADLPPTKFTEVAPYVTELRQFPQILPLAASEKLWKTLNESQRRIFVESADQALEEYGKLIGESGEKAKQEMIAKNNAVFLQVNTEPFRQKMVPFYDTLIKEGVINKQAFDTANSLR